MASYLPAATHATNDALTLVDYNTTARNTTFLHQKPYMASAASAGTSVADETNVAVGLQQVLFSGYGCTLISNTVIVPLTGTYSVYFSVSFSTAILGYVQSHVTQNGTVVGYGVGGALNGAISTSPGTALLSCNTGDQIGLAVFQHTDNTLTTATGGSLTYLCLNFIGSQ